MADRLDSNKMFKHQQHLKLQKEIDEELWISGEELKTDGSSDEETHKKRIKKTILRRKSCDSKKVESTILSKLSEYTAAGATSPDLSEATPSTSEEQSLNWRPKRGSLKLPNLQDDFMKKVIKKNCMQETSCDFTKCPPIIGFQQHDELNNFNDKIISMITSIENMEQSELENVKRLQLEINERLNFRQEMSPQLNSEKSDKNISLAQFLLMNNSYSQNENDEILKQDDDINCDHKNNVKDKININRKDFIRRNIELTATAMSRLPLTDEEKKQLNDILSDLNNESQNKEGGNRESDISEENAYNLCEKDKLRINEIDSALQNFTETEKMRTSKTEDKENFWRNLILDEILKEIDSKLASIQKEEEDSLLQNKSANIENCGSSCQVFGISESLPQ